MFARVPSSSSCFRHLGDTGRLPNALPKHRYTPTFYRMARFGTGDSKKDTSAEVYLSTVGVPSQYHEDLLQLVQQSLGDATTQVTVAKLSESFSGTDLLALSRSIQQQQNTRKRKARQRPKKEVIFQLPNNESYTTLTWRFGESLLDLAKTVDGQQGLGDSNHMEGPCGGQMNCSTCHVYLDITTFDALPAPLEEELDMIDLAFEPRETSRLGCQVKLDSALMEQLGDGHQVVVILPAEVNNEWES